MLVYDKLINFLDSKGISKIDAARIMGITKPIMTYIDTRDRHTSLGTIDKICSTFNLKIEDIVRWMDDDVPDMARTYREAFVEMTPLLEMIKKTGLPIESLAKECGVHKNTLFNLKKGIKPSVGTLRKFCKYFKVKPTDLYFDMEVK